MTDAVNIATIEGFYKEPKNTIDVMMIGASEVYADYSATEAWKNYGYTSYSLGVSGFLKLSCSSFGTISFIVSSLFSSL